MVGMHIHYNTLVPHYFVLTRFQSSLAQLGIPLTDVVKVLVATLLLGNVLFYEAKNQELSMQGVEGQSATRLLLLVMLWSHCYRA